MPVFREIIDATAVQLTPVPFTNEKELQTFFECNLEVLLGIRFVASEFRTGEKHGGRIDTLGLDADSNPVIVEYKWDQSDSVINQGLFYLDWLVDHRGDFELAAQKTLGPEIKVTWDGPRLVIVAATYTKYDSYAVNQLPGAIELLRYQRYQDGIVVVEGLREPLTTKAKPAATSKSTTAVVGADESFGLDYHLAKTNPSASEAFRELRPIILGLDGVEERTQQKTQITYRTTRSFAAFSFRKDHVQVLFKGGETIDDPDGRVKDIRSYGWGYPWSCDLRVLNDLEPVLAFVKSAYQYEQ